MLISHLASVVIRKFDIVGISIFKSETYPRRHIEIFLPLYCSFSNIRSIQLHPGWCADREARSGKFFPTRDNKPSRAWVRTNNIVYIRLLSCIPASAYSLNIILYEVAEKIKWEDLQMLMADTDSRGEQLRRRCAASGWLSAGGFAFSFLYLQFDQSLDSPFILGIDALAVGVGGCDDKTRHYLHRAAQ